MKNKIFLGIMAGFLIFASVGLDKGIIHYPKYNGIYVGKINQNLPLEYQAKIFE